MSDIALRRLVKAFGPLTVLDGLDLDVPDGAIVAVLGASGSGKTTLLRLVAGFERPDRGEISIGGQAVDGGRAFVPPERRAIGYVPQEGALFPHLTVGKNIGFGLSRHHPDRRGRVAELLELVGMEGLGRRYPHELSGGQQQRVALARALAPRPRVVLLDEPFSALDATMRATLRAEVMTILRNTAVTTVLVTHDQEEALSAADLVGVMVAGRVRQVATPGELYARPADEAVARFLGEANLVSGVAGNGRAETRFGSMRLVGSDAALGGPVTVLIRPEQLRLVDGGGSGEAEMGTVVHREYYGHDSVLLVDFGPAHPVVRIRCPGVSAVEIGARVALGADGPTVAWPASSDPSPADEAAPATAGGGAVRSGGSE